MPSAAKLVILLVNQLPKNKKKNPGKLTFEPLLSSKVESVIFDKHEQGWNATNSLGGNAQKFELGIKFSGDNC